jgi:hypothetical protein
MLSQRSKRNTTDIIPRLLREYHQPKYGDDDFLDLSQAENLLMRGETLAEIQNAIAELLTESVRLAYRSESLNKNGI